MLAASAAKPLSAKPQSTSHSATIFWLDRLIRLVRPIPPTPTPAMFSRSLGGVIPRPSTCRGTIMNAVPAAAAFFTNSRRVLSLFPLIVPPEIAGKIFRSQSHRSFLLTPQPGVTKNLFGEQEKANVHPHVCLQVEAGRNRT